MFHWNIGLEMIGATTLHFMALLYVGGMKVNALSNIPTVKLS